MSENPVSIQLFGSDEDSLAHTSGIHQENTKTVSREYQAWSTQSAQNHEERRLAMWLKDPDEIYSIINWVNLSWYPPHCQMRAVVWPILARGECPRCWSCCLCPCHAWPYPQLNVHRSRRPRKPFTRLLKTTKIPFITPTVISAQSS